MHLTCRKINICNTQQLATHSHIIRDRKYNKKPSCR